MEEQLAKAAEAPEKEHRQESPRENTRVEEFQNVKQASAEADLSYYLYRMGLASREEVQRSFEARDRASEELDIEKPLMERLLEPEQKPREAPQERAPERPTPAPSRHRRRERGRGR